MNYYGKTKGTEIEKQIAQLSSGEAVDSLDIRLSDDIIKRLEAPYVPHIKSGLF